MNHVAERIAKLFHTYYEELAPRVGYSTRKESAVPWEQVPAANKQLMRATVEAVLGHLEREANFKDGDEVECVISIPGADEVFCKVGECGKLSLKDDQAQVMLPDERWWTTVDRHELALHFKAVSE